MRVGAEAAASALQAPHAAQAPGRVLTVHAAPVRVLPVGIAGRLGVVVEAARDAGVIPPVVIALVRPGERGGRAGRGARVTGRAGTSSCRTAEMCTKPTHALQP